MWGLQGGMYAVRTGVGLLGLWTYAKKNGAEQELIEGVKAAPVVLFELVRSLVRWLLSGISQ